MEAATAQRQEHQAPAPFTLRFTAWECGHHQQRPDDIPVHSPEQAKLILRAIGNAISQPGSGRAVLFDEVSGWVDLYVTDDYAGTEGLTRPVARPVLVHGAEDVIAALLADDLREARDEFIDDVDLFGVERWDGASYVWAGDVLVTTMTPGDVQAMVNDAACHIEPREIFQLPPVFRDAVPLLERLRQLRAEFAAEEAEQAS